MTGVGNPGCNDPIISIHLLTCLRSCNSHQLTDFFWLTNMGVLTEGAGCAPTAWGYPKGKWMGLYAQQLTVLAQAAEQPVTSARGHCSIHTGLVSLHLMGIPEFSLGWLLTLLPTGQFHLKWLCCPYWKKVFGLAPPRLPLRAFCLYHNTSAINVFA